MDPRPKGQDGSRAKIRQTFDETSTKHGGNEDGKVSITLHRNVEPDRRGVVPEKVIFHEGTSAETVVHEPISEPPSAPVSLTSREESERIRSDLGHEIWRCAGADCGVELVGKKTVDYFKYDRKYFCKACWHKNNIVPSAIE